jgi:hypothetical protein
MLSEWTAECSHDDPTLIVPWSDQHTGAQFVDLRTNPYDIAEIAEVEHNATLARALRSLNATRSPFLTAKCDTWALPGTEHAEALQTLRLELMLPDEDAPHGFASYIDILWRERSVFASPHQQKDRLDRITRRAQRLQHPEAALECVLRPALLDLNGPLEGFAFTLYVTALGPEPEIARRRWELALEDIVDLLRGKELEPARGSATIDSTDAYPLRVRNLGQSAPAAEQNDGASSSIG